VTAVRAPSRRGLILRLPARRGPALRYGVRHGAVMRGTAKALRTDGCYLPASGWRRLTRTARQILFRHRGGLLARPGFPSRIYFLTRDAQRLLSVCIGGRTVFAVMTVPHIVTTGAETDCGLCTCAHWSPGGDWINSCAGGPHYAPCGIDAGCPHFMAQCATLPVRSITQCSEEGVYPFFADTS
jgi:hypothetical protein